MRIPHVRFHLDALPTQPEDVRVMVAGCTGYIGRFVTKELIKRGYQVVAFSREKSGVGGKKSMDDVKSEFVLRLLSLCCACACLFGSAMHIYIYIYIYIYIVG
jgi:nucleoside-diphosphate-sugar epimerase